MNSQQRAEALQGYGKDIQDYRMQIASRVGDEVAKYVRGRYPDALGLVAHGAAKTAQNTCLAELEKYAYQHGLADDPRD